MMREKVENGELTGGPAPYGYRRVGAKTPERDTRALRPDAKQAKVVRELVSRVARGETFTRIAQDLNRRGIAPPRGERWSAWAVKRIALHPRYAGFLTHHGEVVGIGNWPALVDEPTWLAALDAQTHQRRNGHRAARQYLLTGGLLRCGTCGNQLYSKPQKNRSGDLVGTYACKSAADPVLPGCGGVSIRAEFVEPLVTEWVLKRVGSRAFARALNDLQGVSLEATQDVRELEAQLDSLSDMFTHRELTEREWRRMRRDLLAQIDQARQASLAGTSSAAVGLFAGKPDALRTVWPDLSLDRRQGIVRALIDHIVIAPVGKGMGRTFDPSRVGDPVWRA
jgi:hypothetical protein